MKPTVKAIAYGIVIGLCATSVLTVNCAVSAKSGDYRYSEQRVEEIVERRTEVPETGQIESERAHEQTTREKVLYKVVQWDKQVETVQAEAEGKNAVPATGSQPVEQTAVSFEEVAETIVQADRSFRDKCSDAAQFLGADHEIFLYLYDALDGQGIAWWCPYAIAQIFQESRWNPKAENKNGLDKGLLQYRITYWNTETMGDIFDYRAQINRYVGQTANRLRAGCSIEETISRHMMSDWGEFNAKYVADVMRWYREVE